MKNNKCSICGCTYEIFSFKSGYVCEGCLNYLRDDFGADTTVRCSK